MELNLVRKTVIFINGLLRHIFPKEKTGPKIADSSLYKQKERAVLSGKGVGQSTVALRSILSPHRFDCHKELEMNFFKSQFNEQIIALI